MDATVVDGKIYLISGMVPEDRWPQDNMAVYSTYKFTNVTEVYDPSSDSWETKTPIPQAATFYASAVVDKKIYIISYVTPTR
jgi:N-acetylneuraminic acid mutarotase